MKYITLILFAACNVPPHTEVCMIANGFDQEQKEDLLIGLQEWSHLGFIILDDCNESSEKLYIQNKDLNGKAAGLRSGNHILIDSNLSSLNRRIIAAHEAGHALLDTSDHLPVGPYIMSSIVSKGNWHLAEEDITFALERCDKCKDWYDN